MIVNHTHMQCGMIPHDKTNIVARNILACVHVSV